MKTIFSSKRKHMSHPYYIEVYEQDGALRYIAHISSEIRKDFEKSRKHKCIYRLNVYPKRLKTVHE